jgi:hypothetical protein
MPQQGEAMSQEFARHEEEAEDKRLYPDHRPARLTVTIS